MNRITLHSLIEQYLSRFEISLLKSCFNKMEYYPELNQYNIIVYNLDVLGKHHAPIILDMTCENILEKTCVPSSLCDLNKFIKDRL